MRQRVTRHYILRRLSLAVAASATVAAALASTAAGINDHSFTFNAHWGGFGLIAGRHENLCAKLRVEPGSEARILVESDGSTVTTPGHGVARSATLVCGPMLEIWGHTAGPWDPNAPGGANWLSIRCPGSLEAMSNGAGYFTDPHPHVTQLTGGFGHDHDGYWHYRFHNFSGQAVRIQFWGVCSSKGRLAKAAGVDRPAQGEWKGSIHNGAEVSFAVVHEGEGATARTAVKQIYVGGTFLNATHLTRGGHFVTCHVAKFNTHWNHSCLRGHFTSTHEVVGEWENFHSPPNGTNMFGFKSRPWSARPV